MATVRVVPTPRPYPVPAVREGSGEDVTNPTFSKGDREEARKRRALGITATEPTPHAYEEGSDAVIEWMARHNLGHRISHWLTCGQIARADKCGNCGDTVHIKPMHCGLRWCNRDAPKRQRKFVAQWAKTMQWVAKQNPGGYTKPTSHGPRKHPFVFVTCSTTSDKELGPGELASLRRKFNDYMDEWMERATRVQLEREACVDPQHPLHNKEVKGYHVRLRMWWGRDMKEPDGAELAPVISRILREAREDPEHKLHAKAVEDSEALPSLLKRRALAELRAERCIPWGDLAVMQVTRGPSGLYNFHIHALCHLPWWDWHDKVECKACGHTWRVHKSDANPTHALALRNVQDCPACGAEGTEESLDVVEVGAQHAWSERCGTYSNLYLEALGGYDAALAYCMGYVSRGPASHDTLSAREKVRLHCAFKWAKWVQPRGPVFRNTGMADREPIECPSCGAEGSFKPWRLVPNWPKLRGYWEFDTWIYRRQQESGRREWITKELAKKLDEMPATTLRILAALEEAMEWEHHEEQARARHLGCCGHHEEAGALARAGELDDEKARTLATRAKLDLEDVAREQREDRRRSLRLGRELGTTGPIAVYECPRCGHEHRESYDDDHPTGPEEATPLCPKCCPLDANGYHVVHEDVGEVAMEYRGSADPEPSGSQWWCPACGHGHYLDWRNFYAGKGKCAHCGHDIGVDFAELIPPPKKKGKKGGRRRVR